MTDKRIEQRGLYFEEFEEGAVYLHRPGRTVTEAELRELCAAHLTRVKVPVSVTVLDALPKNPVGKIDKPTLRQRTAPIVKGS